MQQRYAKFSILEIWRKNYLFRSPFQDKHCRCFLALFFGAFLGTTSWCTQGQIFRESCKSEQNLNCNYTYPTDMALNGIPLGAKPNLDCNQFEKYNYNPNLVWINKIHKIFLCVQIYKKCIIILEPSGTIWVTMKMNVFIRYILRTMYYFACNIFCVCKIYFINQFIFMGCVILTLFVTFNVTE